MLSTVEPAPVRRPNHALYATLAVALAVAVTATWLVIAWIRSTDDRAAATADLAAARADLARAEADPALTVARARAEVERAGRDGLVTFNTLGFRTAAADLDRWARSATGKLRDEVLARRDSSLLAIEQARTTTTGEVLSSAVTAVDPAAGTATVVGAVKVTVTVDGQQPSQKFLRLRTVLQRTGEGWKLAGLETVDAR